MQEYVKNNGIGKLASFQECTGCGACRNICPTESITMEVQFEGFCQPKIQTGRCIHCGKCEAVCPINKERRECFAVESYGAYAIDSIVRYESSSGGIFTVFAEAILKNHGIVYGAAFDKRMYLRHIAVEKIEDLGKLRGSKYLQSDMGMVYRDIRTYAENGRQVLFVGTPCQVAGVRHFLGKDYANVFLVEFICHGVPSQSSWNSFLASVKQKHHADLTSIAFRDKRNGWKNFRMHMELSDGKKRNYYYGCGSWYRAFDKNIMLRNSCHSCKFKGGNTYSDICFGDLWGASRILPEFDGDEGVSALILYTKKGMKLVEQSSDQMVYKSIAYDEIAKYNRALYESEKPHKDREEFLRGGGQNGALRFDKAVKKYCMDHLKTELVRYIFPRIRIVLYRTGLLEMVKQIGKKL